MTEKFSLGQNFPNPFNPTTAIGYHLPKASNAKLAVYDLLGREVAVLMDGYQTAGEHHVTFDARNLSTGVYFYRLMTGSFNVTRKMLVMK